MACSKSLIPVFPYTFLLIFLKELIHTSGSSSYSQQKKYKYT